MIQTIAIALFGLITLMGTSEAAVRITLDDQGNTSTDVFDNQVYYHLENGNLDMRIDLKTNMCSLFLHDQRVHIEGKCDEAQKDMETAMSDVMKQQGISREQMMAMRKMMAQNRPQRAEIKAAGTETIAGVSGHVLPDEPDSDHVYFECGHSAHQSRIQLQKNDWANAAINGRTVWSRTLGS